jgi:hypothetical protein
MTEQTGQLILRCPVTGLEYGIGVQMDPASFSSLPAADMKARCPHCGEHHDWKPSEAKLKRNDVTIAHRRVA